MTRGAGTGAAPALGWHRDRDAWAFVALRFTPALAALSLIWEVTHLPLYTLWEEGTPQQVAFAVLHCTVGDVLIGLSALLLALIAIRAGPWPGWRWPELTAVATLIGVGYTGFSEWLNTVLRQSWAYSDWMLVLPVVDVGLSPLLQWMVIVPMALWLARRYSVGVRRAFARQTPLAACRTAKSDGLLAETGFPECVTPQPVCLTQSNVRPGAARPPRQQGERR